MSIEVVAVVPDVQGGNGSSPEVVAVVPNVGGVSRRLLEGSRSFHTSQAAAEGCWKWSRSFQTAVPGGS